MKHICFMEPQCKGWQHEMVNSGMLSLVEESFDDVLISLYADEDHCRIIKEKADIELDEKSIEIPKVIGGMENTDYYYKIGMKLIQESKPDVVVLLSSYQSNMYSFSKLAKQFQNIKFVIVVHAIMEWLLSLGKITRRDFIAKQVGAIQLLRELKKLASCENVEIISYGPYIKDCARYVGKNNIGKFHFLHHPYPKVESVQCAKTNNKLTVGILGACINSYSNDIVSRCEEKVDFILFNKDAKVTREEIVEQFKMVDCLLLPYDKKMYRLSASGILFDAINYGIPIICLDSPILQYYNNRFDIGWTFKSVPSLCDFLKNAIIREELNRKRENTIKAKRIINQENRDIISSIL